MNKIEWYSEAGQDKWVAEFFNYKKNGYFLDIGAGDGTSGSNTYYLEKNLEWKGLCIDCKSPHFESCKKIRSNCVEQAIWSERKLLFFNIPTLSINSNGVGNMVLCDNMTNIINRYNIPSVVDYVSLDIEGCEIEALKGWPWKTHIAILWTIEHNLYLKNDPTLKNGIFDIMSKNGYIRTVENVSCKNSKWGPYEDWYVHKDYFK